MPDKLPFEMGKPFEFFGVDNTRFRLGQDVFEAVEDPDDGYRSYLETVRAVADSKDVFFKAPLDTVTASEVDTGAFEGYELTGADGHVWLRFGTDNADDYYPCFTFEYTPKPAA